MALAAQTLSRSIDRELSLTQEHVMPEIKRNAFLDSPVASIFFGEDVEEIFGTGRLRASGKETQMGGQRIQVNHELGTSPNTGRLAGPFDRYTTGPADTIRRSEAEWKHYTDAVTISDTDRLINRGPDAIADVLVNHTRNAISSIVEFAAADLYDGTAATALTGLSSLISANDSVQGLSGATYPRWNSWGVSGKRTAAASVSFASGGFAAQGLADMRTSYIACTYGVVRPTVGLTTELVWSYYEGSIQPQERYAAPTTAGDAGFTSLAYKQTPLFGDPLCTSGVLYWVNTDRGIKLIVLEGADFTPQPFHKALEQEASTSQIQLKCNLVALDRRLNNKLTGITA